MNQSTFVAAAVLGLVSMATLAKPKPPASMKPKQVRCIGHNACSSLSGCEVGIKDCGLEKNSCKGQGWAPMTLEACLKAQARGPEEAKAYAMKGNLDTEVKEHLHLPVPTLQELKKGGFILYVRHASRDTQAIREPEKIQTLDNANICKAGTSLNEQGRKESTAFGKKLKELQIPVGDVFVSPTCRTREMAELAFGKAGSEKRELIYVLMRKPDEEEALTSKLRELVSTLPKAGTNTVLLSHTVVLQSLGVFFPKDIPAMGDVVVIEPLGHKKFHYRGIIPKDLWTNNQG